MTIKSDARTSKGRLLLRIGVVALAAATLAACGSSSKSTPSSSTSGGSAAGGGSTGGSTSLSIGYDTDPAAQGYDPIAYSTGQRLFFESMYDTLFVQQADGSTAPELVKTFKYNSDNTALTLTLRDDVTFNDGSKLTATLVKKNLDRRSDTTKLPLYGAFAAKGSAEIKNVAATDPSTVVLTFASAQSNFETQLAGDAGMILGEKNLTDSSAPDGSGPYTLDTGKTVKGNTYVLTRKSTADASKYPYANLTYKIYIDAQARANAMVSGQVDVATILPSTASILQQHNTGLAKNGGTVLTMPFFDKTGVTSKPFGSKDVRLAFNYMIDRNALVNALYKGSRVTSNAFPLASKGYDPALDTTYTYNLDKAKQLLASGGYPNGFSFDIVTSPATKTDMEALAKQFSAAGITMNVKTTTSTDELFAAVTKQPIGWLPLQWPNEVGVASGVVVGGFMNLQKASDPVISAALGAAANAKGDATGPALKALNDALINEAWLVTITEEYSYFGYNAKKIAAITFPGTDGYPLLSSIHAA